MKILGINQVPGMVAWTHDSAAALIIDGTLIATAEEERFNRLRHARGFPHRAVDYCLKEGKLAARDIDIVAISYDPWQFLKRFPWNVHPMVLGTNLVNLAIFAHFKWVFAREHFPNARVVSIHHHLSHAASAYRCSGFAEANILTIDGSGETETFTFFTGRNGRIEKVWDIPLDGLWGSRKKNSIGLMYTRVTNHLKLGVQAEGKTMGLASYGTPRFDFSDVFNIRAHDDFTINRQKVAEKFPETKRERSSDPLTEDHKDLAASLQHGLEEGILNLAREAYGRSGIKNFCLAGGVALNCNTNSKIAEQEFCENIFVQPAASDGGVALGAALEASAHAGDRPDFAMETAYWGPSYSDREIKALLDEAKVRYEHHDHIEAVTAKLLSEGKIVGWFQGRMELGPRALCNRSILADPTVPGMNDRVNENVKHREVWRPFAPVVVEEDGATYFEQYRKSPFMLLTFYVKKGMRDKLPAVTHADGSSRIQTINASQNPRCYKLLREFEKLGGVPVLMNTSFNDRDEPIVCSPKDALRCFSSTGLDALVMGDYLIKK